MKRRLLLVLVLLVCTASPACEHESGPMLAPADQLAWAVAHVSWERFIHLNGLKESADSIRKLVAGRIRMHEVNVSYTCPKCRVVMRAVCNDPHHCVFCSKRAMARARLMRAEMSRRLSESASREDSYRYVSALARDIEYETRRRREDRMAEQEREIETVETRVVTGPDGTVATERLQTTRHEKWTTKKDRKDMATEQALSSVASDMHRAAGNEAAARSQLTQTSLSDSGNSFSVPVRSTVVQRNRLFALD